MSSIWTPYLDAGWALCDIRPGSKAPRVDGWQKKGAPFNSASMSAGLVHEHSGTCAVDIDDMQRAEKWLAERDVDIADLFNAPDRVQLIGNPANHGKLLYRLPAPRRSKKVTEIVGEIDGKPQRKNIIDFRCAGNQDVLPPSIHPDTGVPYAWAYGDPLLGHWSVLPEMPAALDAIWAALVTPLAERPAQGDLPSAALSIDDLTAWLDQQDPDCDRDSWVQIGMRVHTATNGQGFYIWDNWSRKGEKYAAADNARDMQAAWRSFKVDGGLGVGPILAAQVAKPDEFPLQEPTEFDPPGESEQVDNSAGAVAYRLLKPRLIFLSGQGRYYFLRGKPAIKELDEDANQLLPNSETVNVMFTKHMPSITNPKTGAVSKRIPTEFLKDIRPFTASNIGFHPGEKRLYVDVDGLKYLNAFVPEIVEPLAPKIHELEAWDFLINRIADHHYRRWLMQFYGYILQNPGKKVMSAPLLYSTTPGTGKSTLMKLVPSLLFGKRWVRTVSSEALTGRFTGFLSESWFIVLDELKTNGGKYDRMQLANKMKPWITEPELEIERKGENHYMIRNRVQITATSNFEDAVQIEDDDRRWGVSELSGKQLTPAECADLYTGFLSTARAPGVLKHIFSHVDLVGFNPAGQAPRTAGREVMVSMGLSPWVTRMVEAADKGEPPFDRDLVTAEMVRDLLSPQPSLRIAVGLLKRPPFQAVQIRGIGGQRMYCWRNLARWEVMTGTERSAHIETGARPAGYAWDLAPTLAIRQMAGDDAPPDPNADLLGIVNG